MITTPIIDMNRELAEKIDNEVRENPAHPYKGEIVGIANGKVGIVADTLHEVFSLRVIKPQLGFDHNVPVVSVPNTPLNFDGIAAFCFLSRFTYGNFGHRSELGLEM